MKGIFITFEGPDGGGKTTQIQKLAQSLQRDGYEVLMTREPGGTRISDLIRSILLSPEHTEMVDQAEVLLYAASRAQHIHEKIIPALNKGKIVLCDRFIDASIAYQSYGLGMDVEAIRSINAYASSDLQPLRTYMLDISVEVSRKRLATREQQQYTLDRIEQKEQEYHSRVREGFLNIANIDKQRVMLIDANRPVDKIHKEIRKDCTHILQQYVTLN